MVIDDESCSRLIVGDCSMMQKINARENFLFFCRILFEINRTLLALKVEIDVSFLSFFSNIPQRIQKKENLHLKKMFVN